MQVGEAHEAERPQWDVLLIGGSSGTGKTLAAQEIGRRLSVSVLPADDVRLACQQVTSAEQQPALHYFLSTTNVWGQPPEALRDGLIEVARALVPALAIIIANHIAVPGEGPLIIEGDAIMPELAGPAISSTAPQLSGPRLKRAVRAVFVYEADERALFETMGARGRGFEEHAEDEQRTEARMSWLYGEWLGAKAETLGLPVLAAQPWESLPERILEAAG